MRTYLYLAVIAAAAATVLSCSRSEAFLTEEDGFFHMKGVVLSVDDLSTLDWPALAAENGINTIGTHIFPDQVAQFSKTEKGKEFYESCRRNGIEVEHQLHSISQLLPRELFAEDSTMFRMDSKGRRTPVDNCCIHSEKALETIAANAVEYARILKPTNHRYYFWIDDGKPVCMCPYCSQFSPSEQALIIENRILKALKTIDPDAMLAHLAYQNTLPAPVKVQPESGIFLEFAPIHRRWDRPLSDTDALGTLHGNTLTHGDYLKLLEENLKVFPAETAVVLEYWLDSSLFSRWRKPAVKVPWNRDVFLDDLGTYAEYGIRNVTSFAVYMDSTYFKAYPDKRLLKEYGVGLTEYGKVHPKPFKIFTRRPVWKSIRPITGFHAPWDGLDDETEFRCAATHDSLFFRFNVKDATPTSAESYKDEMDVVHEDRVEVFFSPAEGMKETYYGAEVDFLGRILDYSCDYYRHFHYEWDFSTMKAAHENYDGGYSVTISVSRKELEDLGIRLKDGFFFGAFRADYRPDESVNWYSMKLTRDKAADFHKPNVLFPAVVK
ncbi:MAG: DUF4838 domain-containing protein [Bacteroidales bacterium]|nr:DUF4838 domain-containing protein [Bacteroidales bacterium]